MPDLNKLFASGSQLEGLPEHFRPSTLPEMAAISFRQGLKAYFSTYQTSGVSTICASTKKEEKSGFRVEDAHAYVEAYTETILHIHFGIELAIKELLRQRHPLLASKELPDSAVLLCHLLDSKPISFSDEKKLKSVEFSCALQRTIELTKAGFLDPDLSIIIENKNLLDELNILRNKIIHRGMFVINYSAFDLLIAHYVLPFFCNLVSLPQFENQKSMRLVKEYWIYPRLDCGIELLNEIIQPSDDTDIFRKKLAFLKELGRAAYCNPIDRDNTMVASLFSDIPQQAILRAENEIKNLNPNIYIGANARLKCPVCGLETLVRYNDSAGQDVEVKCTCCTFNVQNSLGNARDCGIDFEPFWE